MLRELGLKGDNIGKKIACIHGLRSEGVKTAVTCVDRPTHVNKQTLISSWIESSLPVQRIHVHVALARTYAINSSPMVKLTQSRCKFLPYFFTLKKKKKNRFYSCSVFLVQYLEPSGDKRNDRIVKLPFPQSLDANTVYCTKIAARMPECQWSDWSETVCQRTLEQSKF